MISSENLQQFRELLTAAQSVVVLIGQQTNADVLTSASGLVAALQTMGKDVVWVGPQVLESPPEYLSNLNQYRTSLGNQNLVISFDYNETVVENVSYHIGEESRKFFLTVKPQKGHKPLDPATIEYSYSGVNADVVILVGVGSYDSLAELYITNEQLFTDAAVVSLHTYETDFGLIKLDASGETSLSSATTRILQELQVAVDSETATSLLAGIEQATNNFKSLSITPETLELSAWLMRQGARRVWRGDSLVTPKESSDSQAFAQVFSKKTSGEIEKNKPKLSKKPKSPSLEHPGGLDYQPDATTKI